VDPSKYAALYFAESRDHLQQCNRHLLLWERDPADLDPVHGLFRSVHTLKGMSATLGFHRVANLAHALETVLSAVRDQAVTPSAELVDVVFRGVDALERGVDLASRGAEAEMVPEALIVTLGEVARPATGTWPVPATPREPEPEPPSEGVAIRVRLRPGTALPGARALVVLRQARALGVVTAVRPAPEAWQADGFLGELTFRIATGATEAEIRRRLRAAGEVEEVVVQRDGHLAGGVGPRQVRVELGRLDRLVTLAGELVVSRGRLSAMLGRQDDPDLEAAGHRLGQLAAELQDQVLQARMAPVTEVFERFPRMVRDLARQLGKEARVEIEGGDIELDRAILDELPDALVHLVRNAIDHGLESPAERVAAGKPAEGRIGLRAVRQGRAVVITVEDDGRGVDRQAVRAQAEARGWVTSGTGALGEEDLLRILARPGFTTARSVSDLSGRGVGIDAVVHRIRSLGGATELSSRAGAGTTIALRLPLTMAVVPALLIGLRDQRYAVPLSFVAEATRLAVDPELADASPPLVRYRDRTIPLIDLGAAPAEGDHRPGVILDVAGRQGALAVDTLLGQQDVVVSPFHAPGGMPGWINGATILPDGGPVLIVDPTALV
jgi:two-component system chemotaxis sensor kinase CheA